MNGILKEFFSVSRVLTKPGQTIEISMLNAFSSTNAASARSRVLDTDYAKETAELARAQIIQQAATAMLAQANQQPQIVLALLQ